ncbi:hypothetical protein [Clostridioides difficile]|uniref:hypothetical protein n=1 Tax=Clostridioides difficile TaxID=1496 RepID=UPI003C6C1C96
MKIPSLFWGFILTKWYVNKFINITTEGFVNGFILTKWYVNIDIPQQITPCNTGFILTKWYVNIVLVSRSSNSMLVLY